MKAFKILSILLFFLLVGVNNGFAQSEAAKLTDAQKEELTKNIEEFQKVLNLSDEQKEEFKTITKKYAKQMIEVKDSSGGKYKKYKKVKSIQKNKNAEMKKMLSEEQYEAYLKKQKEMQKKIKANRG